MRVKTVIGVALAIAILATIFTPTVSAADASHGIELSAVIKEPKPQIGITVDTNRIDFGELLPGDTSSSHDVVATNVGLKPIEVSMEVQDDGNGVFEQGIEINGNAWDAYSSQLVSDDSDSFGVALHVPDDAAVRGPISGMMTVFAQAIETPVAEFSANVTSGVTPLSVQFTDESSNSPMTWSWDFNDDGAVDSTEQNPTHTYDEVGTYSVNLTVGNLAGSDTMTKEAYITVTAAALTPSADFSADVTLGTAPVTVQFTDISSNEPTAWQWDFGDGNTSTEQNPSHEYSAVGIFTVSLTASNSAGSDTGSKAGYVLVASPAADFNYNRLGDSMVITGYKGPGGIVIVPGAIDGVPVTSIGNSAFYGCTTLTSVTMLNSITTVGVGAFIGCTALTTVVLGNGVTDIDGYAFYGCTSLNAVAMGSSVTAVGNGAFSGCTALAFVAIPDSVLSIGDAAFLGCDHLTSAVIGSGVTSIGNVAFAGCSALSSMVFIGNAPSVSAGWAYGYGDLVVYYGQGATGFTTPVWNGVPCYLASG